MNETKSIRTDYNKIRNQWYAISGLCQRPRISKEIRKEKITERRKNNFIEQGGVMKKKKSAWFGKSKGQQKKFILLVLAENEARKLNKVKLVS